MAFDDGEKEFLLAAEVCVDGASRIAGRVGNVFQRGATQTPLSEELLGRVEQEVPSVLDTSFPRPALRHRADSPTPVAVPLCL